MEYKVGQWIQTDPHLTDRWQFKKFKTKKVIGQIISLNEESGIMTCMDNWKRKWNLQYKKYPPKIRKAPMRMHNPQTRVYIAGETYRDLKKLVSDLVDGEWIWWVRKDDEGNIVSQRPMSWKVAFNMNLALLKKYMDKGQIARAIPNPAKKREMNYVTKRNQSAEEEDF